MSGHRMLERELQAQIVELARMLGYLVYHTHNSRRSAPGFPDLVLVHPRSGYLVAAELKTETGKTTPEQDEWLRAWALRGLAFVWRPSAWRDGSVARTLQRFARPGATA